MLLACFGGWFFLIRKPEITKCNASSLYPETTVGQMASGACPASMTGTQKALCKADGTFAASDTSGCVTPITHCSASSVFPYTAVGATASATCPAGFTGSQTSVCQSNGSFSPTDASNCKAIPVACSANGIFPITAVGGVGSAACPSGYTGTQTATCKVDGTFAAADMTGCILQPRLYPPVPLSQPGTPALTNISTVSGASYGNGTYVTSQSSWPGTGWQYLSTLSGTGAYSSDHQYNSSGAYTGSVSTTISGVPYTGEWFQIQFPLPLNVKTWMYTPRIPTGAPATFIVAGSNDGVTWTSLFSQSTPLTLALWANPQTFAINSPSPYLYYRWVTRTNLGYAYTDSLTQNIYATGY